MLRYIKRDLQSRIIFFSLIEFIFQGIIRLKTESVNNRVKLTTVLFCSKTSLLTKMQKEIEKMIKNATEEFSLGDFFVDVSLSKNQEHGDYCSGISLKIAKETGQSPIEVAQKITHKILQAEDSRIEKIEVVTPGFINFFLSKKYLKSQLVEIMDKKESYGSNKSGKGQILVIDYSSPNIAKSFGVGHLRSTIIGQSIYNIYKFLGWECIGDNHLGDWGTQFGKLIYQIKKSQLADKIDNLSIGDLEKLYVSFHRELNDNPEMEDLGREWFKRLESGDEEAKKIWKACVDISIKEFNRIYQILGVEIDVALGESFYRDKTQEIIDELKDKKVAKKSRGALIVEFNDDNLPPLILVKSDGTTTYFARDLATIKYRVQRWNPDLIIYEVGSDQSLYFKQLFEVMKTLDWTQAKLVHVAHGLVRWKHGKFSTRKGETIHLEEILNETIERARKIIDSSATSSDLTESERSKIAEIVGVGAVKYNDLSQHYSRDILFDWDKMLNLKGNSAPYIQYTFTRTEAVISKIGNIETDFNFNEINDREERILKKVRLFPYIVDEAGKSFSPNLICNFLFELSQDYNLMYGKDRIIGSDKENQRVAITKAVNQVIKNGLNLLGIEAPSKM
ncbi:MAG: arginine--tRNA ligase [Minisyncoccales bacterium]|jgi:arginyl-tRNA synthetase